MRLLPAEMISIVVSAINALVDSMITGHFLGTGAMAAIGLFSPVTTIICLSFVIASGMQILCGQHIGSGEKDQVVSLFSTGMAAISIYALMLTALLLLWTSSAQAVVGMDAFVVDTDTLGSGDNFICAPAASSPPRRIWISPRGWSCSTTT